MISKPRKKCSKKQKYKFSFSRFWSCPQHHCFLEHGWKADNGIDENWRRKQKWKENDGGIGASERTGDGGYRNRNSSIEAGYCTVFKCFLRVLIFCPSCNPKYPKEMCASLSPEKIKRPWKHLNRSKLNYNLFVSGLFFVSFTTSSLSLNTFPLIVSIFEYKPHQEYGKAWEWKTEDGIWSMDDYWSLYCI